MVGTTVADGTFYVAPGGGYSASGLSFRVVMQANRLLERVVGIQKRVEENASEYAGDIERTTGKKLEELHMTLVLEEYGLAAIETQSLVQFNFDTPPEEP